MRARQHERHRCATALALRMTHTVFQSAQVSHAQRQTQQCTLTLNCLRSCVVLCAQRVLLLPDLPSLESTERTRSFDAVWVRGRPRQTAVRTVLPVAKKSHPS